MSESAGSGSASPDVDVDAVVVGGGFAGMRMLHELRELGLSTKVVERGSEVGGTWYWNRYPGARTDTEAWAYAFFFSRELHEEWDWTERFPSQQEAHAYLCHVADRFDMRRDFQFDTRVTNAEFDESSNTWTVTTDRGQTYRCRYFIPAVGVLSAAYKPDFPGIDDFRGQWYLTGRWPDEKIDFAGKRVAVIGTGATGVQVVPIVAHSAEQVLVFQRTPNYVLPGRNYVIPEDERREHKANFDVILKKAREHFFAFPWDPAGRTVDDVTPEERQRILERGWEYGGFRFLFQTFDDIFTDDRSNDAASEFARAKIKSIVQDPATAELLCPDYPVAGKRPPLGHFYYETFNRDNVSLIDVSSTPIAGITPDGVKVGDVEYAADIIIFATGFDAVTGSFDGLDIRGRDGASIDEKWSEGPRTHLGIGVDGFPNMFMICGPQTPFANIPVVIDGIVDWIGRAIAHLEEQGSARMEAQPDAVEQWRQHVETLVNATVLSKGPHSWFLGGNIPGKPPVVLFHFGGAGMYRRECEEAADQGFEGFAITAG